MNRRPHFTWLKRVGRGPARAVPQLFLVGFVTVGLLNSAGCGATGAARTNGEQEPETPGFGGATSKETSGEGGASTGGASVAGGASATSRRNAGGGPGRATGGAATAGGSRATGGATTATSSLNPPISGNQGFATRYWDCCKPSCSWSTAVPACQKDGSTRITDRNAKSGCDGGGAYECYDFSPWYDSATNMSYGFAAYNASGCGVCYQLQFTGESNNGSPTGAAAIKGKQMIVQVINIGNITAGQFDLLIPGGGVGEKTAGCTAQWGSVDLGSTYGGLLSECSNDAACMAGKCQSVFGKIPTLLAGCNWFTGWYSSADNPKVIYKQVSCPSQLTSKSGISG